MPTALPLPAQEQDPASYRDRKKLMWLLSVIAPAIVVVGPVAYLNGHTHPLWFFAGLALALVLMVATIVLLLKFLRRLLQRWRRRDAGTISA